MTQELKIQEAIKMIDNHDWYWSMCDTNYERHYNSAKASMRAFVSLVCTIENASVREALRSLWTLNYEDACNGKNRKTTENFESRKAELLAVITA